MGRVCGTHCTRCQSKATNEHIVPWFSPADGWHSTVDNIQRAHFCPYGCYWQSGAAATLSATFRTNTKWLHPYRNLLTDMDQRCRVRRHRSVDHFWLQTP